MKMRALVSARASGPAFELGCLVREALFGFLAREYPHCLPTVREIHRVANGQEVAAQA